MTSTNRFRPHEHLRRNADFLRVYARRRSVSNPWFVVHACENDLSYTRIGLSVSRRFGNAVKRNRLRRLYREAFRAVRPQLPTGVDFVFQPRGQTMPTLADLRDAVVDLASQAKRRLDRDAKKS